MQDLAHNSPSNILLSKGKSILREKEIHVHGFANLRWLCILAVEWPSLVDTL